MIKRIVLASALAIAFATPALAGHCPVDVKAIDNGLAKMSVPAAQMSEVKALRDKGDAEHKAGSHGDSVKNLAKAMRIILNSQ